MKFRGIWLLAGLSIGAMGWLHAETAGIALVKHAPAISGTIEGSVQQMTGENAALGGRAVVHGDLLVPGRPLIRLHGHPCYGGTSEGSGSMAPGGYLITLSGDAELRHVVRRTDPLPLPPVDSVPPPSGRRSVTLHRPGQSPGDFGSVRNLTLGENAGRVAVPPGCYGEFAAGGRSGFVLGVAGATQPSVYSLQRLTLEGSAGLEVVGPVALNVAGSAVISGPAGSAEHPAWLQLKVAHGGVMLDGRAAFFGRVIAPKGTVVINGHSRLTGAVACDRLTVDGGGLLRLIAQNQPPTVTLDAPADGTAVVAFTALTLTARAADLDGFVAQVEFFNGSALLGAGHPVGGQDGEFAFPLLAGLPPGRYSFTARAVDDDGAETLSSPVTLTATATPNTPPEVTLTAPAAGAVFAANAPVTLAAMATDSDGTITRVEFLDGGTILGDGAAVAGQPGQYTRQITFAAVGTHTLAARATDDDGAFKDSEPVAVTVPATLPYRAGFEADEGFALGSLAGQLGWDVLAGTATVDGAAFFSGSCSLVLAPGMPAAEITQTFGPTAGSDVVFVDLFARPASGADLDAAATFDVEGARFALVQNAGTGEWRAFNGDGVGGGQWQPAGNAVPLAEDGATRDWIRLTTRLDFVRQTWDLYADAALIAADLKFRDNGGAGLTRFGVRGHAATATRLDELYAGTENPLFADADRDGMDDAWEVANGLNPNLNDREGDLDGDGVSNIREYLLRLKANNADTDGDGLYDGDEVAWGWGPATPNPDTDPPTPPTGLTAIATTDRVVLSWLPASDNLRVSGYLVYRNGQPIETDQPVRETHYTDLNLPDNESFGYQVRAFDFAGNLSAPSDRVSVRTQAADADANGLPDFWEQKYFPQGGVDPNADDDGDGISNLEEYRQGSNPRDFYNGVVPVHDVLYSGRPGPNDELAMIVRHPDGSPWPNAPVDFDITSGRRRIAAAPGGPYAFHVTVRAAADGLAQCYLEPLPQ
jgi:Bacterial Ig domain/Bacterial TSP3 repeat